MGLIDRIHTLMKAHGIATRAECERACGLANGTIAKWAANNYRPTTTSLEKVANYFHVSTDYLLGKTDEIITQSDREAIDEFQYAMLDASKALTDAQKRAIIQMIKSMTT